MKMQSFSVMMGPMMNELATSYEGNVLTERSLVLDVPSILPRNAEVFALTEVFAGYGQMSVRQTFALSTCCMLSPFRFQS